MNATEKAENLIQNKPIAPTKISLRKIAIGLIVGAALAFGIFEAYTYWVEGRFTIATDDAYVKSDVAILSAKIAGYIVSVNISDNIYVKKGDLLATIDPTDYGLSVRAAEDRIITQESTIERVQAQIDAQNSTIAQAEAQLLASQAEIDAVNADLQRANSELDRTKKLVASSYATSQREELALADRDRFQARSASAKANVAGAQASLNLAKASQKVQKAQLQEAIQTQKELQTALAKAQTDFTYTEIRAPFDGIVGNKSVQIGQYVQPGTRLMALIPDLGDYVEANFKETQLGKIKVGQKAALKFDVAEDKTVIGQVESIAPASGSEYSLLPPENATGNFTKIVQRIPVRIMIPASLDTKLLRIGTSVEVSINFSQPLDQQSTSGLAK